MKKQWIALLTGCVLVCSMLAGCGSKPQTSAPAAAGSDKGCTDEAILSQLKNDGTPEFVLDGTYYTLPLETSQLIQAGWSLETEEYDEQFRDAIVQQILMQLDGIEAQLNGDGTYTEQGDLLYIFTINEGDIVTTQYYIVKDYGFCLIQLTNFSGSETTEQAARDMVDSFVWDTEG